MKLGSISNISNLELASEYVRYYDNYSTEDCLCYMSKHKCFSSFVGFIEILYGQTFCSCFYCWVIKAVSENLLAIRGGFKHGRRVITLELSGFSVNFI